MIGAGDIAEYRGEGGKVATAGIDGVG